MLVGVGRTKATTQTKKYNPAVLCQKSPLLHLNDCFDNRTIFSTSFIEYACGNDVCRQTVTDCLPITTQYAPNKNVNFPPIVVDEGRYLELSYRVRHLNILSFDNLLDFFDKLKLCHWNKSASLVFGPICFRSLLLVFGPSYLFSVPPTSFWSLLLVFGPLVFGHSYLF